MKDKRDKEETSNSAWTRLPHYLTHIHLQKCKWLRSHAEIQLISIRTGVSWCFLALIRQAAFTVGKLPQVFDSIYVYLWLKYPWFRMQR